MKIVIKGTKTDITPTIKEYIHKKIGHLTKFLRGIIEARVELEILRSESRGDRYRCEVMIFVPKDLIRGEETATDMYAAIDLVIPKLKRQLEKYKGKIREKHIKRAKRFEMGSIFPWFKKSVEKNIQEISSKIVKRKRCELGEPMTETQAIKEMESISHDFYIFKNSNTKRLSIIYKRDEGDYGLIEPE